MFIVSGVLVCTLPLIVGLSPLFYFEWRRGKWQ